MQLGVIGLGRMGSNMVRRLLKAGHECVVFDMSPKSVQELVAELEGRGRLVIRKSGTEPLIRVMAEGDDPALVQRVVDDICEAVQSAA